MKCNRLYGVMNKRLADREFLAGAYSIADMACDRLDAGPTRTRARTLRSFRNLKRWFETMKARPAVRRGIDVGKDSARAQQLADDKEAQKICSGSGRALSDR